MIKNKIFLSLVLAFPLLSGCNQDGQIGNSEVQAASQTPNQRANALFDELFMQDVLASPVYQTYLGIKTDYDKWDQMGPKADEEALARANKQLLQLEALDSSQLTGQTLLSHQLYVQQLKDRIRDHQWRHHNYPVNQMFGLHSTIPSLLINQHSIASAADAKAYISRLNGVKETLAQLEGELKIRADKGIIAPKFVFAHVIRDSKNIISGFPFNSGDNNDLWQDFITKVDGLSITTQEKFALKEEGKSALLGNFKQGYSQLISYLLKLETQADDRDGVWKLPEGEAFYNNALAGTTTTNLTANEIHQIGLSEVDRIHDEMRAIKDKVGFKGDLQAFFTFMREDEQFYYPNTKEGKAAYLNKAIETIDGFKARIDEAFGIKPKAEMIVKAVEPFRERSAGKAFYNQPAPDGSRPGIYYANLFDMKAMPTYQLEALAFHEGTPGHHMQIALSQELEGLPKFRRFGSYTSYIEGWGLYSEYFPKEMGFYADPYSDFGRLAMELWRACRLVVDTGIHAKKWTREQGIAYYVDNTPNASSDAVKMVERHIVMASQATAYKIGMLKILELREKAQKQLGDKYQLRDFHDVVLENGPVPLNVLEQKVNSYIKQKQA